MKKIGTLLVLVVMFMAFNSNTTYAQPEFKIFLKGGFNLAMQDFKGTISVDSTNNSGTIMIEEGTYGIENGYALGGAVKYYFGAKRKVGLAVDVMYNMFTNDFDGPDGFEYKHKINILTLGLGVEYDFMPKGRFNPYIGAGLTGNWFSGETTQQTGTSGNAEEIALSSTSRFGAYGDLGADIMFSKQYGFNLGVRYNMANLLNKGTEENPTPGEWGLNDDEHAVGDITIPSRSIGWLQIYAGFNLGLNHPRVRTTRR